MLGDTAKGFGTVSADSYWWGRARVGGGVYGMMNRAQRYVEKVARDGTGAFLSDKDIWTNITNQVRALRDTLILGELRRRHDRYHAV